MSGNKELVEFDPVTGISTYLLFDEHDPTKFHVSHEQDVQQILDRNKALQNAPEYKKAGIKSGFQHFAHIPVTVYMEWLKEGIDALKPEHLPAVKRKLRDPQWRHLRTTLGDI